MRWLVIPLLLLVIASSPAAEKVRFDKQIQPILTAKCQPCHFTGGKMYAQLPFDQPATVLKLGDKLFTRIKDEPSRAVIRRFLAEQKAR